jgi:hypothetical protein
MDQLKNIPWNVSPLMTREPSKCATDYRLHIYFTINFVSALAAFRTLLDNNRALITGIAKKTFKYGSTERHCVRTFFN